MRYHKDLGCWLVVKGECGYSFELCIGKDRGVSCRLELGRQWYVVMDSDGVKLNLRTSEIYKMDI